jgi:hypothetical protein
LTGPRPHSDTIIREIRDEIIQAIQNSLVPVRYMSLKQAAVYSGIGQKRLIQLAKEGKIKGQKRTELKRGDWSFDKESIDRYWHKPFDEVKDETKSILDRIGRKA